MSTALTLSSKVEQVLMNGNLSNLAPDERVSYYNAVCSSLGLNPLTRPFDYLTLNGKLQLYAKRDATDQLRALHGISITITGRETTDGVHVVTARATERSGRTDESTGAVTVGGLKGDALANALMKAETKAKRRVTLSICGLGILDESELETVPHAVVQSPPPQLPPANSPQWDKFRDDLKALTSQYPERFPDDAAVKQTIWEHAQSLELNRRTLSTTATKGDLHRLLSSIHDELEGEPVEAATAEPIDSVPF